MGTDGYIGRQTTGIDTESARPTPQNAPAPEKPAENSTTGDKQQAHAPVGT